MIDKDENQEKAGDTLIWLVFALGFTCIVLWLTLSFMAIRHGEGSDFQRAGVFAQVGALLLFTATLSRIMPDDRLKSGMQRRFKELGKNGLAGLFSDSELADGKFVRVYQFLEKRGGPGIFLKKMQNWIFGIEVLIVVLGTLQTGYGDWLVCSLQEMRPVKCSY